MKILIITFCNHQKLKYNYNKNTIHESKNENIYIMNSTKHDFLSLCNKQHETGQYGVK